MSQRESHISVTDGTVTRKSETTIKHENAVAVTSFKSKLNEGQDFDKVWAEVPRRMRRKVDRSIAKNPNKHK